MNQRSLIAISIATLSTFLFIYFSQPIAALFAGLFFESPKHKPIQLGRIITSSPGIFVRRAQATKFIHAGDQTTLHHGDIIKVEKGSDAILAFAAGDQVRVFENSLFRLELFRAARDQKYPLLLTVLHGTPMLLQKSMQVHGFETSLFISKDGQWLGRDPVTARPRVITPLQNVDSNVERVSNPVPASVLVEKPPNLLSDDNVKASLKIEAQDNGESVGLSTTYIESVIATKAEVLRRCQLNSLRDDGGTMGSLVLSMTIAPSGRISNIYVMQNQLDNDQLVSCTLSALKRLQFNKFAGDPVTLAYPIEYR